MQGENYMQEVTVNKPTNLRDKWLLIQVLFIRISNAIQTFDKINGVNPTYIRE